MPDKSSEKDANQIRKEAEKYRRDNPEKASEICAEWPKAKSVLLIVKSLPFTPKEIKDAIDKIIVIGDTLCS